MLRIVHCQRLNGPSEKAAVLGWKLRGRFLKTAPDVWRIHADSKSNAIATALRSEVAEVASSSSGGALVGWQRLPTLEAMGGSGISRALSGIALCNHSLERPEHGVAESSSRHSLRVAFQPSQRVFVLRSEEDEPNPLDRKPDEIRQCMQMHLRLVQIPLKLSRSSQAELDIIRVAAKTDLRRLGGLIHQRWCEYEEDSTLPMVTVQAVGPPSMSTMVRALAHSWQKSARAYEGDASEAGFACVVSRIQLPDDRDAVQCELVAPVA